MSKFKRILCALLCACIAAAPVASGVFTVGAEDIQSLSEKIKNLDEKKQEYQDILDKTASDIAEKEEYNDALANKISVLDEKIQLTREAISEQGKKISETQKTIDEADAEIDSQMDALCERLRAIYMAGSASNLEIILGAKDFSDMIDKMTLVKTLTKYDRELIDKINDKLTVVNEKKAVLEDEKKELEAQETSLNEDLTDLNTLLAENSETIAKLEIKVQNAQSNIDSISSQQAEFEAESQKYFEQQAALARKKAAQQSATQASTRANQNRNTETSSDDDSSGTQTTEPAEDDSSYYYYDDTPSTTGGYVWPTPGYYTLTSVYGEPRSGYGHGAIDIGAPMGAAIVAAASGTVSYAYNGCYHNWGKDGSCGCGGGYGNYVTIDHGDGRKTLYGHMTSTVVSIGQYVTQGQVIGYVGSTGWSSGAHLHFETLYYGVKYDPMSEY